MLIPTKSQLEKAPDPAIETMIKHQRDILAKARMLRINDLDKELLNPCIDPVVSGIGLLDTEKMTIIAPCDQIPEKSELVSECSAVFRRNKLVGWLSPEESRACIVAKGEFKTGTVVIPHPDNPQNLANVEITKSKSKLSAKADGNQVKARIKIQMAGNFMEQMLSVPGFPDKDPYGDHTFFDKLNELVEDSVKSEVEKLIARSQKELEADILGVGRYIRNCFPKDWERIESNWRDYYKMQK